MCEPDSVASTSAGVLGLTPFNPRFHVEHFCTDEERHLAALHLRPGAPPELVKAAYRALAKVHHPDHGGNGARMAEITAAYEALAQ